MDESVLRSRGFHVTTRHFRFYTVIDNRLRIRRTSFFPVQILGGSQKPYPRGGITIVHILYPDGEIAATGEAYCSPKDNYNRKEGRQIALGRAVVELIVKLTPERTEDDAAPQERRVRNRV